MKFVKKGVIMIDNPEDLKEKAEKYLQILNDYVKNIDSLIGV